MASSVKSSHELTLKDYQQQLKDNIKRIYDNFTDLLRTKTEHLNFEVQVKSAEIVRSYQLLMQLVAEIRSFLIVNDLVNLGQSQSTLSIAGNTSAQQTNISEQIGGSQQLQASAQAAAMDEKLVRLRDEMSMFLYELEIPLQ